MLKTVNYQGKGLGLHEKVILEPIHVKAHPGSHGLGYISQSTSNQNVGTTNEKSKYASKHTIISSHHSSKSFIAIPHPPPYKAKTTSHLPHSSSKSILGHYTPKSHPPYFPTHPSIHKSHIYKINKGTCPHIPSNILPPSLHPHFLHLLHLCTLLPMLLVTL